MESNAYICIVKSGIASYFIIILYVLFTVGIVIEYHNHNNECEGEHCEIHLSDEHELNSNTICEVENHHHHNHDNCTFEEFKIDSDYISEEKVNISIKNIILLSFINTYFNNSISTPNLNSNYNYLKIPDKRLFYKLSIYQLSSILC